MHNLFVSDYITVSKFVSLLSLKTRKHWHLIMKTIKGFVYVSFDCNLSLPHHIKVLIKLAFLNGLWLQAPLPCGGIFASSSLFFST